MKTNLVAGQGVWVYRTGAGGRKVLVSSASVKTSTDDSTLVNVSGMKTARYYDTDLVFSTSDEALQAAKRRYPYMKVEGAA